MRTPNPATLDELGVLLDRATNAFEVFGDDLEGAYRRFAMLCHPDRYAGGPDEERAKRVFQRLTQWREWADGERVPGELASPSRSYILVRQLARGDLANVYLAVADGSRYVLKITRPSGGNPLLASEARHLRMLCARSGDRRYREYLPCPVESFVIAGKGGDRQVNAFAYREGFFTLEAVRQRFPSGLDARHLAWIFKRMLVVAGFAHACGLVHGALLPPHVMIHAENHGLMLLDWIHAVPIGDSLKVVPTDYRAWYPPEVLWREEVGPATDIFLAAKCLVYLAGGDPLAGRFPGSVPSAMTRFLGTCLLDAPRMRPQGAWTLHEEYDELLERLFGPPKYHHLLMS